MNNKGKSIDLTAMSRREIEEYAMRLSTENEALTTQLKWYEEQIRLSRQKRFGASSEKTTLDQLSFFNEAESEADELVIEPEMKDVFPRTGVTKKKKGHKNRITRALPKRTVHYELSEEERVCPKCGGELHFLKNEVRREITVIPAQYIVTEHIISSYACRNCDVSGTEGTIVRADAPSYLLRNSLASPSLVADIIVKKYHDALPLYRQEKTLNMRGMMLSRQTMSNWIVRTATKYLTPLYDFMHSEIIARDIIHADETEVEVLKEPGRNAESKSYMWMYRTSGCDSKNPIILYDYRDTRSGTCPEEFLRGFSGYLQTDGYAGYHSVTDKDSVIPVGCLAHVKRKYDEAIKAMPADAEISTSLAAVGLNYCNRLFDIERKASESGMTYEQILELRKTEALPVFSAFLEWAEKNVCNVLPKSKLGKALTYTINQAPSLKNYMLDGRLEISNNRAERSIKPFVIGRKNWLFSNTPAGAHASAVIYSLMETAKECQLDPFKYFSHLFTVMPGTDINDTEKLKKLLPYTSEIHDICHSDADESVVGEKI